MSSIEEHVIYETYNVISTYLVAHPIVSAFAEGVALIASPCILPVLPLVLSTSVDGGKARPFGITFGFVLSFSLFVLASRQIVQLLHIDLDVIRYVSLALLFALGLVMLSNALSEAFSRWTQGIANVGNHINTQDKGGFGGGMLMGSLIGFVWTPCAGPVLATVLVQAILQKTDMQSVYVTLGFAIGAGVPMLIIALFGKHLTKQLRLLPKYAGKMRKIFAVLILGSVGFITFGSGATNLFASGDGDTGVSQGANAMTLQDGIKTPYPAPELTGIQEWLNSPELSMQGLKGKVVLVDFWTYSCINCVRTLPYITAWDAKYRDKGLVIIGVHAPEFEFEKKVENIQTALAKHGIHYPVAVDNNLETWQAFKNRYWPAHYLIDKNGNVVYTHFGEGHYDITESNIRYLLGIKGVGDANPIAQPTLRDETPETYLGFLRAERFIGTSDIQKGVVASYSPVNFIPVHNWSLGGRWVVQGDKIIASEKGSYLRFNFRAKKVFLVMGTTDGNPQKISLKLNGSPVGDKAGKDAPQGIVTVNGHTLYELINQKLPDNSLLEITAESAGIEMYAFTFGE